MSLKCLSKLVLAGVAAVVAGCSADDVQLNGKVFDALGVNTSSVERKTPELKARTGIVVPPNLSSLPEPGSGGQGQPDLAEVQDYDAKRTSSQQDLERQQAEYCKKHYEDAKIHGDQDVALAEGPLGRCQKSALSLVDWGGGTKPQDGQ